jgi:type II secretory pathway component PulJ
LVELMVALVVGLIVVGAVLALVVSIMKSNRQTLQSTRLNQELRATVAVIANDLRRARSVTDPLTSAKLGNPYNEVDTATAKCVRYAYAGGTGGDYRVIVLPTSGINADRVVLATSSALQTCDAAKAAGSRLGSDQVAITDLAFSPPTNSQATRKATRKFDVTVTGHLIDQDAELSNVSRSLTQTVYVRSIAGSN